MSAQPEGRAAPKPPAYDPDQVYHCHVDEGRTVVYGGLAFGDRATLQVPGAHVESVLAQGAHVVDPAHLPDAATIGTSGDDH